MVGASSTHSASALRMSSPFGRLDPSQPLTFFFLRIRPPPRSTLFPYPTPFRSGVAGLEARLAQAEGQRNDHQRAQRQQQQGVGPAEVRNQAAFHGHHEELAEGARRRRHAKSEQPTSPPQPPFNPVSPLPLEQKK